MSRSNSKHRAEPEVFLELQGRDAGDGDDSPVTVDKSDVGRHGVKLVVNLPIKVGAEEVDLTTALVFEELDRLPPERWIGAVSLSGFHCTNEGADSLHSFLESQASAVHRIAIHHIVRHDETYESIQQLEHLCSAFNMKSLRVLDLSSNSFVGPSFWNMWKGAEHLEQIILDNVALDTLAWKALVTAFVWENVEDLQVVLKSCPDSEARVGAIPSILSRCTRLLSLRWMHPPGDECTLPIKAFQEMTENMLKVNVRGGSLRHLVLGTSFQQGQANGAMSCRGWNDLCATLQHMPRLRTLKLRGVGLTDVDNLVDILQDARPPLEVLDLSQNALINVEPLQELADIPKLSRELKVVALSDNKIETKEAHALFATFRNFPIDLKLERNPIDWGTLVREFQKETDEVEEQRDRWRSRAEQNSNSDSDLMAELNLLREKNKQLQEEYEVMMRAFQLVGTSRHMEEQTKLMERVKRLEDMVSLGATFTKKSSEHIVRRSDDRPQPTGDRRRVLVRCATERLLPGRSHSLRSTDSGAMERFFSTSSTSLTSVGSCDSGSQRDRLHSLPSRGMGGSSSSLTGPGQLERLRAESSRCVGAPSAAPARRLEQFRSSSSRSFGSNHASRSISARSMGT